MNKERSIGKRLRDHLFFLVIFLVIRLLRLMPRRAALLLMRLVGNLVFLLAAKPRERTIRHLALAYGTSKTPDEIREIARRVFGHFTAMAADIMCMPNIIRGGINKLVTASGTEHLDQAFATGRGVILVTCHFGNWELLGAWLAQNGYPMKVVGTTLFDPRLDEILVETRNSAGNINLARGKGTREIIRTLKDGEAVGMLIDQDTQVKSTFVNFFGRPAHTPTGPALLARRLGVPIIPIFMYRKDDLNYQLECLPPLELVKSDDEEGDIRANTQLISDAYEAMIRRFPEQWAWMHKRWYTQPSPDRKGEVIYVDT